MRFQKPVAYRLGPPPRIRILPAGGKAEKIAGELAHARPICEIYMTCCSSTNADGIDHRSRAFDVMTFADVCVDLIVTGDVRPRFHQVEQYVDISLQLGGSGAIFASQLARL